MRLSLRGEKHTPSRESAKGPHDTDPVGWFLLDLAHMAQHAAFGAHAALTSDEKRAARTDKGVTLFCGVVPRPKL